jgi:hypothetical protein
VAELAGVSGTNIWLREATGLVWVGAREVVTTSVPVIDDSLTATLDAALLTSVALTRGREQRSPLPEPMRSISPMSIGWMPLATR